MPTQSEMKAVMQKYLDAFNAEDADAVIALYADNATIEDPVGSPTLQGKEAIGAFYRQVIPMGSKLKLVTPIRGSHSNSAAMAFVVESVMDGNPININVIDVMTFDESGKITSMRAYWGKEDYNIL
ncbi:nuclear transport factor 2 family protein [Paenibacillus sp. KQZ6P-2]|uniref:Nuclear transport factor 2 family protein n=1 Tax=Paenibacillus mangrovi TaxID=2931978 RepID=A0A9X1WZN4_9BACL|nr:steroid Delta-isomerase [Paenibacillus mangrovi]MCJ8015154.1 nuclear transport factor 2 family protein [Paenibacillus mangrovi]